MQGYVLVKKLLLLYVLHWLSLPEVCLAYTQYAYFCSQAGHTAIYQDLPCPANYQQKIFARAVSTVHPVTKNSDKKPANTKQVDKAKQAAVKRQRQIDRCESVKERIKMIEDKLRSGYKASQKPRLDSNMQTLQRLQKKYCIIN